MYRLLLFAILNCISIFTFSQIEISNAQSNYNTIFNFQKDTLLFLPFKNSYPGIGPNPTISSETGKLLYYTHSGGEIRNYNDEKISIDADNGKDYVYPLIVPVGVGRKKVYYEFRINRITKELVYSIIDMNLNGGKGKMIRNYSPIIDVVSQKIIVLQRMKAVKHANNIDTWLIAKMQDSKKILAFLITECGIQAPVESIIEDSVLNDPLSHFFIDVSPDGSKLVTYEIPYQGNGFNKSEITVYKFDNQTGLISNPHKIKYALTEHVYPQFSPLGKYLYVTKRYMKYISGFMGADSVAFIRYNLLQTNFELHPEIIINQSKNKEFLNCDIYLQISYGKFISSCNGSFMLLSNLDSEGDIKFKKNEWQPNSIQQGLLISDWNPMSSFLLPNYDSTQVGLGALKLSVNRVCVGDTTIFNVENTRAVTKYWWHYGNGVIDTNNTRKYRYPKAGKYNFKLIVKYSCKYDTIETTVFVDTINQVNLGEYYQCSKDSLVLNAGDDYIKYNWKSGDTTQFYTTSISGKYRIKVTNACGSSEDTVVYQKIIKNVNFSANRVCLGDSTNFSIMNPYNFNYIYWDYGNGIKEINKTKTYLYSNEGIYQANAIFDYHCYKDTRSRRQ